MRFVNKKIQVTGLGKEIALAAESIISEIDNINYKSQNYKNNLAGHLKIAIVSTGKYIMPYFLADYLKQNSGVDLTMDVTNYSKVLSSLLQYEIEFALISHDPDNTKFEKFDLIKMDVQGSELDIIKGAVPIIKKTTHLILETQTLNYNDKAPKLTEIVCYLNTLDFSLIDIIDLHYSLNNILFQIDVLFERKI